MDKTEPFKDPLIIEHQKSIAFIAEYEDGSEDYFRVHRHAIRQGPGDHVARMVAAEWQRGGRLKPGKIVRVYRDPKVSYIS
jgi:hypothetical protein